MRQFKPAIFFLLRFVGVYFVGNILYGVYVESYGNSPDPFTYLVTLHTSTVLNLGPSHTSARVNAHLPTVNLDTPQKTVLRVYEGCNGINVAIVFVAFIIAFGGPWNKMSLFIPVGLVIIHAFNLVRISLLFYVAQYFQSAFYYVHKYVFTLFLYAIVFGLWSIWVIKIARKTRLHEQTAKP